MLEPRNGSWCQFPESDWGPGLKSQRTTVTIFSSLVKKDWLCDPPECECQDVVDAKDKRSEETKKTILIEADKSLYKVAVRPVVALFYKPIDGDEKTVLLSNMVLGEITPVIFDFKFSINRGRPEKCCEDDVDPLIKKGQDNYPAHPSFPSGHATLMYVYAALFGKIFPRAAIGLKDAAKDVALRRVIGGWHFPSDSAAGEVLAGKIFEILDGHSQFAGFVSEAKAEWKDR